MQRTEKPAIVRIQILQGDRQPAKTSVSPETSLAAKSEEKRMFSQARG